MDIRSYRKKHGLSQQELGDRIRRTQGAVGHWETGRNRPDPAICILLELESGGEILARELRPDLFPAGFRVALSPRVKEAS